VVGRVWREHDTYGAEPAVTPRRTTSGVDTDTFDAAQPLSTLEAWIL
jgi:hypothetical protein